MTDAELLTRYVRDRDQPAFAELVTRHARLVLAAARRLAPRDADDVAQAAFVLLAQRAHRLLDRRSLAGSDLIGDGTGSGATNAQYGSLVGTTSMPASAKLGQLADNGGDVKTIAIAADSPAINLGYNNGPTTDARGVVRGSTPDDGAYKYAAPVFPTFRRKPGRSSRARRPAGRCWATPVSRTRPR